MDTERILVTLPNPRKWIRVLELLPGKENEPLRVRFRLKRLSDPFNRYEAISYVWGDGTVLHKVTVELGDEVRPVVIDIRQNLWHALHRFRQTGRSRLLWADAICINQNDVDEKGNQVAIMGRIFHGASRVLAWLGRVDDGSDDLFNSFGITHWTEIRKLDTTISPSPALVADAFMSHPHSTYWTRTWIVQELVQAKSILVCYGSSTIQWGTFVSFLRRSGVAPWKLTEAKLFCSCVRSRLRWESHPIRVMGSHLGRRLEDFADADCSDLRDKVYAMLSISTGPIRHNSIPVDYTVSLLELYCRTLEVCARFPGAAYSVDHVSEQLKRAFILSEEELDAYVDSRGGLHLAAKSKLLFVTRMALPWCGVLVNMPRFAWRILFSHPDDPFHYLDD